MAAAGSGDAPDPPVHEVVAALKAYIATQRAAAAPDAADGFKCLRYRHAGLEVPYLARVGEAGGHAGASPVVKRELEAHTLPQKIWPASFPMAEWLATPAGRRLVEGKAVLELGSGVGLVGLVAAKIGAKQLVLSDLAASSLALCELSLALDGNADITARCVAMQLRWACDEHHVAALRALAEATPADRDDLDRIAAGIAAAENPAAVGTGGASAPQPPPPPSRTGGGGGAPPPPPPPPAPGVRPPAPQAATAAPPVAAAPRAPAPASPLDAYAGPRYDLVIGADVFYFRASLRAGLATAAALLAPGGVFVCVSAVRSDQMEADLHAVGAGAADAWTLVAPPTFIACTSTQEANAHPDFKGVTLFQWRKRG